MTDEREIIELLRQEDERCMKLLFDAYYQALCVFALKYMVSFGEAEDIVQEVYVVFWEKKKGTAFIGSLKAYFFAAVQKACFNSLRSSGRFILENIGDYTERFVEEAERFDEEGQMARRKKLKEELDKLPEKARAVLMSIVLENMQYKEVAERYGISVNTVKTQYARALKQLRDNLDQLILILLSFSYQKDMLKSKKS